MRKWPSAPLPGNHVRINSDCLRHFASEKMVIPLGRWAGLAMSAKISVTTQRVGVICILFLLWKISEARCTSQTCYMKRECVWNHTIWCSLHVSVHPSFLTAGTAVRAAQEMTIDEGSQAFKRMPPAPNAKRSPKKLELDSDLEPWRQSCWDCCTGRISLNSWMFYWVNTLQTMSFRWSGARMRMVFQKVHAELSGETWLEILGCQIGKSLSPPWEAELLTL